MEVQFRPYSLVANLSTTDASSIALNDTAGNPIECNFIAVEASGANTQAFYRAAAHPAGASGTPLANYASVATALGTTSGIVGGYASVNKGVVELLLSDADRSSTVQLQLNEGGSTYFFITYGQIQGGNISRDNLRPVGN